MITHVEVDGLPEVIAGLEEGQRRAMPETARVVGKGCGNIKEEWKQHWTGWAHIPHLPRAISYDVDSLPGEVTGEVGPVSTRRQGGLGSYIELGTVNSPPIPGGWPALDAEAPRFERALADMGEDLIT